MSHVKTAELIEMPFGWLNRVGSKNHTSNVRRNIPHKAAVLGAVWPNEKHWESLLQRTQQKG